MDCDCGQLCLLVLDVRKLWVGDKIRDAAAEVLCFLSTDERAKASNFYFLKDAKLSLASSLLKRLFGTKCLDTPWTDVQFARLGDSTHGKPCLKSENGSSSSFDFNISHQAGLVVFFGSRVVNAQVGIDVTCVDERNDRRIINKEGFDEWVDMHGEMFSKEDLQVMKSRFTNMLAPEELNFRIRRFYAYWALKEAYVKLEGEALLAKWLKAVEFRNVRVPEAITATLSQAQSRISNIEVWLHGTKRGDVEMMLESFEENYLIATALKSPNGTNYASMSVPVLRTLDLQRDVIPFAAKFDKSTAL